MSVLAVLGSAPCGLDDLNALLDMRSDISVCVINDAIRIPVKFEYFLTGHPVKYIKNVLELRERGALFEAIGADRHDGYDSVYRPYRRAAWGGSVANAICLFVPRGFRVVLCGCPFDASGHFDDATHNNHCSLWDWFLLGHPHRKMFDASVRSMSGKTRELFGYPTKEWLNEPCQ